MTGGPPHKREQWAASADYICLNQQLNDLQCHERVYRMWIEASENNPQYKNDRDILTPGLYQKRKDYLDHYFDVLKKQAMQPDEKILSFPSAFHRRTFLNNSAATIARVAKPSAHFQKSLERFIDAGKALKDQRNYTTLLDCYHSPYMESIFENLRSFKIRDTTYPLGHPSQRR